MKKIGKYEITNILGKGAMGIVYKALDPDINREVAIKTIRFELTSEKGEEEELMKRFIREAQAAGKLAHPNIITIYDVGREKDLTYIVMQFIEGQSLQRVITSGEKYSTQKIIQFMSQLCDALDYAHQNGIVHRDIKPANILINKKGNPFIADFGVARVETSTLTQTGTTIGTPSYMSPEQVMGKKVDNRADIFSLGVILYELLTGKRPFEGESITTVIYKIIHEEPLAITEVKKNLSTGFEIVTEKALSKDPNNRYKSCKELAKDLQELDQLSAKTITMRAGEEELPTGEKGIKLKPKLIIAISFLAVLLAGGGGFLYFSQKKPAPSEETKEMKTEDKSLPSQAEAAVSDAIKVKLQKTKESFDKEDYAGTVKLAEEILAEDADNTEAQELLNNAKNKMNEALIVQDLAKGISNYEKGEYEQCKRAMEKVLKLDKENKEARQYWYLADTAISRKIIRQIVERQRKAEEEKDLLSILNDIGSPALSEQRRSDATFFFNNYDKIKSHVSNVSIKFQDASNAEVSFSHLLSAVYKKTGQRQVHFEGIKTWKMKKIGKFWKITNF